MNHKKVRILCASLCFAFCGACIATSAGVVKSLHDETRNLGTVADVYALEYENFLQQRNGYISFPPGDVSTSDDGSSSDTVSSDFMSSDITSSGTESSDSMSSSTSVPDDNTHEPDTGESKPPAVPDDTDTSSGSSDSSDPGMSSDSSTESDTNSSGGDSVPDGKPTEKPDDKPATDDKQQDGKEPDVSEKPDDSKKPGNADEDKDSSGEIDSKPVSGTLPDYSSVCVKDKDGKWVYIVKLNDTLGRISGLVGYSVQELAEYNHIENVDLIFADQAIRIPV